MRSPALAGRIRPVEVRRFVQCNICGNIFAKLQDTDAGKLGLHLIGHAFKLIAFAAQERAVQYTQGRRWGRKSNSIAPCDDALVALSLIQLTTPVSVWYFGFPG